MARSLRPIDVFPITTRHLTVLRVADVTPGMRRVTLGGEQLAAHTAENGFRVDAFRSDGFDDEFKILLKHPDADEAVGPTQADGVLNWPREDPHLVLRTYTVRRWDPSAGEIDVDFVVHGVGPATSWARRVQPGEPIQIAGPKSSSPHPEGVDWTLVAGDDTALPAIGRWLEEWPAGARGQVFIEVAEAEHRQLDLPVPDGVELTWLVRDGAEPGTTTLLFDALKAAPWWDGKVFAWVAGETMTLTPIRRWLRNEKELSKDQVEVTGYWRRQEVVVSDDTGVQDLDATEDEREKFHELAEVVPGFALRVAASIGLADAFSGEPRTVAELASTLGADPIGLSKLLRYLSALEITELTEPNTYRLTNMGRELENDYIHDALTLEGLHAQSELGAMLSLLSAVRTGSGDHERWYGKSHHELLADSPELLRERAEDDAEVAVYVTGAFTSKVPLDDVTSLIVSGRAAVSFAEAVTVARPETQATVVAAPSEIAALRTVHGEIDRISYAPGSILGDLSATNGATPADAVLFTDVLAKLPDADAAHALRGAADAVKPGGRILVFAEVLDPELADEHEYEHDLINFALHGGGERTHEEYVALFTAAGLPAPERSTIGWGYTVYTATLS